MQETPRLVLRTIGRRLIRVRNARGLTQEEFAEHLGIDVRLLRRIEAGTVDMHVSSLCKLARRLGVSPRALMEPMDVTELREPRRPGRPRAKR